MPHYASLYHDSISPFSNTTVVACAKIIIAPIADKVNTSARIHICKPFCTFEANYEVFYQILRVQYWYQIWSAYYRGSENAKYLDRRVNLVTCWND